MKNHFPGFSVHTFLQHFFVATSLFTIFSKSAARLPTKKKHSFYNVILCLRICKRAARGMTDVLYMYICTIYIFTTLLLAKKNLHCQEGILHYYSFLCMYAERCCWTQKEQDLFKRIVNVWHILDEGFLSEECYFIGLSSVNYYYRFFFYIAERPAVGVYILLHCCDGEIFRFLKWCRRCRSAHTFTI